MIPGLHRGQWEFRKVASQLTPGCCGSFFNLAPSGIPPADPPLRAGRLASGVGAAGAGVPRRGNLPHDPAITQGQAQVAWVEHTQAVMVAVDGAGAVVGTYYLRPNSLYLGAHVANAGYVVAEHCRRQGIGSRLYQHSLQAARRLGFRAMQFNLVVSTNTAGIRCWQRNGFQVIGTLPGVFRHRQLGYVDAFVMIKELVEGLAP
jgi:L-amino acid N-acyltransferase YncA